MEVFRQQVAWRTAVIFGSSSVKAQLLDTFRRFRYHAAVSNSGIGADGNVILDVAVQRGVVFYARTKLTKALKFLQSYADADSGRIKGYRAVVNCRAMMHYRRRKLLFARQQLRNNFAQALQKKRDDAVALSHYMSVSVFRSALHD